MYMYVCIYMYVYIYIHTYTQQKWYKLYIYPNPYTNIRLKHAFGVLYTIT